MCRILLLFAAVVITAGFPAGVNAQANATPQEIPAVHTPETQGIQDDTSQGETATVVGPNDSVTVVTIEAEELNKVWHVSSSGDLDLPMAGRIHAAGLTTEELEKEITARLSEYIRHPQVTVYISEFRSQPITITGAVKNPGIVQIQGPKTLLATLTMAGGVASPGPTVTVTREQKYGLIPLSGARLDPDGKHNTITFQLKDALDPTSSAANLEIRPNDVIAVSTQQRLVYIIGEVNRPGSVELATVDRISIMQVLAVAGGLTKVAAPGSTEILRINSQGLYERVGSIDVKRVMRGRSEDRLLTAGDIVVVPSSNLKLYTQTAAMSAIGGSTMLIGRF